MDNKELKKKIIDVLQDKSRYKLVYYPDDNDTEVVIDYEGIADAIIATGIVADVRDNKPKECCESSDTPFTRIVEEKRALDEKIGKLNAFLKDEEKAGKIVGFWQLRQMREQLDVMLRYSSILNTRILTWKHK